MSCGKPDPHGPFGVRTLKEYWLRMVSNSNEIKGHAKDIKKQSEEIIGNVGKQADTAHNQSKPDSGYHDLKGKEISRDEFYRRYKQK